MLAESPSDYSTTKWIPPYLLVALLVEPSYKGWLVATYVAPIDGVTLLRVAMSSMGTRV